MGIFKDRSDAGGRLDEMNSRDKADMIRRLEREREKVNTEIESILRNYSKESGNRALRKRRKKIGSSPNDWSFDEKE